jgi:hypothetical protein
MTKETKVLETAKFLSLNNSAKEWAKEIFEKFTKFKRKDTQKEISDNNFNIKNEIEKLGREYMMFFERNVR